MLGSRDVSGVRSRGWCFPEDSQKQINANLNKACLAGGLEVKKVGEGAFSLRLSLRKIYFILFFILLEEVSVQEMSLTFCLPL